MPPSRVELKDVIERIISSPSRSFWLALQIPIFVILNYIYSHRPLSDPTSINYDIRLYFDAGTAVLNGRLPYRDFFFQYPPAALFFFIPPRMIASDLTTFFFWFNIELLLLACIGLFAASAIARQFRWRVGPTLLVYSLGLIAIGAIIPQRYDLAPAVLVVLSLAAWSTGRQMMAYALLAVGVLTKIYPALILPLYFIIDWRTSGKRSAGEGLLLFMGIVLLGIIPFLILSPRETVGAFAGQAGRGFAVASVYATLLLAGRSFGVPATIAYQQSLNTWNVQVQNLDWLTMPATGMQVLLLLLFYLRFFRTNDYSAQTLVRYSAAAIGIGILTSKVFAAQYVIWLFPLAFLVDEPRFVPTSVLFMICALITQLLYPFLWNEVKEGTPLAVLLALARDASLVALCWVLIRHDASSSIATAPIPAT